MTERDTLSFRLLERLTLRYSPGANDPEMMAAMVHVQRVKGQVIHSLDAARWHAMLDAAGVKVADWPAGAWCD